MDFHHSRMRRIRTIHFIGIGGAGMSGIADVLLTEGYCVTGSDLSPSKNTEYLQQRGARIFIGHQAEHIAEANVVVVSSAVPEHNLEVIAAKLARTPIIRRAEMLAEIMRFREGIAVAGTHGKSTTTALITQILSDAHLDPTYINGGLVRYSGRNAQLGKGRLLVAEADESDASFLHLQPMMSVVTNIEADHMETYDGDIEKLKKTFVNFIHNLPFYGLAVLCIDSPLVREIMPQLYRPYKSYGFSKLADVKISAYEQLGMTSRFTLQFEDEAPRQIILSLPGRHNALNATAAIIVAREEGVTWEQIEQSLEQAQGVGRRFDVLGNIAWQGGEVTLVDDYGHHPTEVGVTIEAVRGVWPNRRLIMLFEPHRYSRTHDLFDEFVHILSQVDALILLPVYSAGESPIVSADSASLARAIKKKGYIHPHLLDDESQLEAVLREVLKPNDILLTQGAGSIGKLAVKIKGILG